MEEYIPDTAAPRSLTLRFWLQCGFAVETVVAAVHVLTWDPEPLGVESGVGMVVGCDACPIQPHRETQREGRGLLFPRPSPYLLCGSPGVPSVLSESQS